MSQGRDTLLEPLDEIYVEEAAYEPRVGSNGQPESNLLFLDASVLQPSADIKIDLVLLPVGETNVSQEAKLNLKSRSKIELKKDLKANTKRSNFDKKAETDLSVSADDFEYIKMEVIIPDENVSEKIINKNSKMDLGDISHLGTIVRETIADRNQINDSNIGPHFSDFESTEHDIKIELIASGEETSNKINTERPIIKVGSSAEIKHSKRLETNCPSYVCIDCNKAFYSPTALAKHSRLHAVTITQKPYLCEECGNMYLGLTALKIHARTHIVDKPATRFDHEEKNTPIYLLLLKSPSNDSVRKMEDNMFACFECDKSYGDASSLIKHNRVHTSDKPFCCETCGKLFRLRHSLTSHMLCHMGNKTYVCKECNKAFSKSNTWIRHKETCGIIFGCKECGLTFTARHHLNLHSRVHPGVRRIITN